MDSITLERIKTLHPTLRDKALEAYTYINNKLLGKGVRLRFSCTFRTFAEQDAEFAKGRTKPGTRVTEAKGGQSFHNYGLAFDIVVLYDLNGDGIFEVASWDMIRDGDKDGISDWLEITHELEKRGFSNGFLKNGKKWDFPHFQYTFGYSWQQLLNRYHAGKTFNEVIDGKKYIWVKL